MGTQLEKVTLRLREMILAGELTPGHRIAEIPLAARLGVSRTPVRLALGTLEKEGLVVGAPHRGFTVRAFTVREIIDAFDVRGALEGLACRLVAERGLSRQCRSVLEGCLVEAEQLLAKGYFDDADLPRWSAMNQRFHRAILTAADSQPLARAIDVNEKVPLASAGAIAFQRRLMEIAHGLMAQAHQEHARVFDALIKGEATRAESLMREHAYQSREHLAKALADLKLDADSDAVGGLRLVAGGGPI